MLPAGYPEPPRAFYGVSGAGSHPYTTSQSYPQNRPLFVQISPGFVQTSPGFVVVRSGAQPFRPSGEGQVIAGDGRSRVGVLIEASQAAHAGRVVSRVLSQAQTAGRWYRVALPIFMYGRPRSWNANRCEFLMPSHV